MRARVEGRGPRAAAVIGPVLLLFLSAAQAARTAGPPAGAPPGSIVPAEALDLGIQGVGELRFGARFQWKLVTDPPEVRRPGEGVRHGGVSIQSVAGDTRHRLSEPPSYSHMENGPGCRVVRTGAYAILRCLRDYVFNTETGAPPVPVCPQFADRANPVPAWLAELPLPWWRIQGTAVAGKPLVFLDYGYVNYGQYIDSTEILRGPALLDLETGRIAIARLGSSVDSPVYDASSVAGSEPVAMHPERVTADAVQGGRRVVTVLTVFDRCAGAACQGDRVAGFRRVQPLTYVFE